MLAVHHGGRSTFPQPGVQQRTLCGEPMRKETIDTWATTLALRNMYGETSLAKKGGKLLLLLLLSLSLSLSLLLLLLVVVVGCCCCFKKVVGITYANNNHFFNARSDLRPKLSRRKRV